MVDGLKRKATDSDNSERRTAKKRRNWKTLEWKYGPLLSKEYIPLNAKKFKYNNVLISLSPEAEQAAVLYVRHMDKYGKNETFNENFFQSWRDDEWMTPAERDKITEWKKCDFRCLKKHMEALKRKKIDGKEQEKWAKTKNKHSICLVNGKEQKVSNFLIEPPGIYIGRGDNPNLGRLKKRIEQKDIILNCSAGKAPKGEWKEVVDEPSNAWLAKYRNTEFNGRIVYKCIWLSNDSPIQTKKDRQKYDQAQKLGDRISKIRTYYKNGLNSKDEKTQQIAVILYLIDKLSLRIGNEKGEGETDTVGCCTLRCGNITLKRDGKNRVTFDFNGKDSICYKRTVEVHKDVFSALQACKKSSKNGQLFSVKADDINGVLRKYKDGLSAKVFRTYNASLLLEKELNRRNCAGKSQEGKIAFLTEAVVEVAKLCNHQKSNVCSNKMQLRTLRKKSRNWRV